MNRTVRVLTTTFALAALLGTAGCADNGGTAGGASSSDGQLTIGDQAKTLQTLVKASGALKGSKYGVKWAEFQGAAPLFQAVQAGAADTSYSADLPSLQALSGGVQVKNVAALKNDGSHVGIVVKKDSSVRNVADLKGKKVVVSSAKGSISEYLLANALQQAGLSYSDVTVQYLLPTDAQAAFASGKVDVWATFGVYQAVALQQGGRLLIDGNDGRISGYGFIGASDKALADKGKRAALADFLDRLSKALAWGRSHPKEYAAAIEKDTGASPAIAKTLATTAYGEVLPITPDVTKSVQKVADTMHGIKVLDPNVEVADSVDTSLFTK
ncbi:ABC transporter substrate-binding protein [Streptomyces sp. NPDC088400]|uniref:ABC transporter substrate-binding protein n=1 Tax=Streptomyces sp. NPDC088400 TaxID=3365861 RepID=UPI00381016EB